jgi:uncharacterized protein YqgV (UPF0045/DUF77 family)
MAKKTNEVTAREVDLAAAVLAKFVVKAEFAHLKRPIEMVLGGAMIPFLQAQATEKNPEVDTVIEMFSKENIEKMLDPEEVVVEIPVDRVLETIKLIRGKFRRVKKGLNKICRKERALDSYCRDTMIRWWNVNQRLIPDGDPICASIAQQVNEECPNEDPLSSMQTAGYFSYLCRLGLMVESSRQLCIERALKKGMITVKPVFSSKLIKVIEENWRQERADEVQREKDHKILIKQREQGDFSPIIAEE